MQSPALFQPLDLASVRLANRIMVAPMCQYSASDGCMNDWHFAHLTRLALSGAASVTIEATAVAPDGRISDRDVGLWDTRTAEAAADVISRVRKISETPLFVQLSHAGRKGSVEVPWLGGRQIPPSEPRGWQTKAPSPHSARLEGVPPAELGSLELSELRRAFAEAASRAMAIGLDGVELHAAHGYLLHQFLSPLSNLRTDAYGGDLEARMRFPLEVVEAVREQIPAAKPLIVRVSATDWIEHGWDLEQTVRFAQAVQDRGCDAIHVSSGGLDPAQQIAIGPGYQVPFARAVRAAVDIPVIAVGLITEAEHAEAIIGTGDADLVALARAILYDPHWPWHAAARLGGQVHAPAQYLRSQPRLLPNLLKADSQ